MNRQTLYLGLIGVVLCLSTYWFLHNYGFAKERVYVGMQGEARANRLLAARMLLTRMGGRVHEGSSLRTFDRLPARSVILFAADRNEMDRVAALRLLNWVKDGGHLIVAADEPARHDALLDELGVRVDEDAGLESIPREGRRRFERFSPVRRSHAGVEEVRLPDGSQLKVQLLPSTRLAAPAGEIVWSHESQGKMRMLQLQRGEGLVTVIATSRPFDNGSIGLFDHAELLWRLVSDDGEPLDVWLVRYLEVRSLPRWLLDNALPAVLAFGVLLVVALWRVLPRFGPLQPNPTPDRRGLVEHLAAMGRFYFMQRQLPRLLQTLRTDGLELLAARAPETRGQDGATRLKSAARLTGLRPRELMQAFTAPAAMPKEFTQATRILAAFRRQLSTPGPGNGSPRGDSAGSRTERRRDHKKRAEFDKAFRAAGAATKEKE